LGLADASQRGASQTGHILLTSAVLRGVSLTGSLLLADASHIC
jgi:hypothetical protein